MIAIVGKKAVEAARSLPFCYLCGSPLGKSFNRDHVPPKSVFKVEDCASNPLIIHSHNDCNNSRSREDQAIGEIVSLSHSQKKQQVLPKHTRIVHDKLGVRHEGIFGLDLKQIIWRWVRGFHAALYRRYLPDVPYRAILEPFPSATPTDGGLEPTPILEQYGAMVQVIRLSRAAASIDRICAYNGKLEYECAWSEFDNHLPFCAFALRIYDWGRAVNTAFGPPRGCVGFYHDPQGKPLDASVAAPKDSPPANGYPFDPFAPG